MRAAKGRAEARVAVVAGFVMCAAFVIACDPCSTTAGCTQEPRVTLVGQLVDDSSGRPVGGAKLEMSYVSGVALTPAGVTTRSAADGSFELSASASAVGQSVVSITIAQPGRIPYVVPSFAIKSSRIGGSATVLAPWVGSRPSMPVAIIVEDRDGKPIPGAVTMEFRRTSGPRLYSGMTPVSVVSGATDGGYIFLFGSTFTDTVGNVVGSLFVRYAGGDTTVPATFSSTQLFHLRHSIIVVPGRAP